MPIEEVSTARPSGPVLNTVSAKPGSNSIIGLAKIEFIPVIKTIMNIASFFIIKSFNEN